MTWTQLAAEAQARSVSWPNIQRALQEQNLCIALHAPNSTFMSNQWVRDLSKRKATGRYEGDSTMPAALLRHLPCQWLSHRPLMVLCRV